MRVMKNSKLGRVLLATTVMAALFGLPEAGHGLDRLAKQQAAQKQEHAALQARTLDGVLDPQKYLAAINAPRVALDAAAAPGNLSAVFDAAVLIAHSAAETERAKYAVAAGRAAIPAYIKALVLKAIYDAAPGGNDDDAKRALKVALGLDPNPAHAAAADHLVEVFVEDAVEETYTKALIRNQLAGIGRADETTTRKLEIIRGRLTAGSHNAKTGAAAAPAAPNENIHAALSRLGL